MWFRIQKDLPLSPSYLVYSSQVATELEPFLKPVKILIMFYESVYNRNTIVTVWLNLF